MYNQTGPDRRNVQVWKIDETLTVLHGLYVADLDGDGRDEILTASFEGIFRLDLDGQPPETQWKKTQISVGAAPTTDKPGAPRGSSEIIPVRFANDRLALAAIEPWHGNQVVVYTQQSESGSWQRRVLDDTLREGHALVAADFDGDGAEEIIAGWRGGKGGLRLYDPMDAAGTRFRIDTIDDGIAVEGVVAADINLDGRLDLVAIGGRTNDLAWYENRAR